MEANELISFDLIEEHKENIQQLPGGRSAKQLSRIFSPGATGREATFDETKSFNAAIRKEYELELQSIDDHDDPLDVFTRYIKWTTDTYTDPTVPHSQLLPLLERATKTFLHSSDYQNDPRLLKIWLLFIKFFSDAPRETFAFLARHNIGEHLALYYEEFAAWLEGAGRWTQADEVYRLGIDREARPADRLMRKYKQFQHRYKARPADNNEPSSPALPKVRAALSAKIDPFAPAHTDEIQQQPAQTASTTTTMRPKKQKMAIFADADAQVPPPASLTTNGWDSISSVKERKKENNIEAQPWAGQTLKAGKRVGTVSKMDIFKDPNEPKRSRSTRQPEPVINPRTGRSERVYVNMDAVYTEDGEEYSFEELRALNRGWIGINWRKANIPVPMAQSSTKGADKYESKESQDLENLTNTFDQKIDITDPTLSQESTKEISKPAKQKRLKMREVKQETQTIKLKDSPSKPKPRKKISAEPTMTLNTKAAHNDIYDMYNNASLPDSKDDAQSSAETDFDDDTFSTGTGRISTTNSEFGDETISSMRSFGADDTSASPWSDFTTGKVSKILKKARSSGHKRPECKEHTTSIVPSQDQSQNGFDTQAIADLVNQDFDELDTMAIARIAGNASENVDDEGEDRNCEDLKTPIEAWQPDTVEVSEKPRYVPIAPEDYEPTAMRGYRDPSLLAQNKLPFMTPIVERTESSLAASTIYRDRFSTAKTPSRANDEADANFDSPSKLSVVDLLLESPRPASVKRKIREEAAEEHSPKKVVAQSPINENQKILFPVTKSAQTSPRLELHKLHNGDIFKSPAPTPVVKALKAAERHKRPIHKGPIINDLQCNPCDEAVIEQILNTVHPAPSSYIGFFDQTSESFNHFGQIKAYTRKLGKQSAKSSPRKALSESTRSMAPLLKFNGGSRVYAVKKELGEGAFAPVYLVGSTEKDGEDAETSESRGLLEALKAESEPKTLIWEFHVLHLLKARLGRSSRTMESIVLAHECHLYRDECYLVLEYHSQGTLLDLVNLVRTENTRAGKTAEGLEEPVVMWLAVELLRTMEEIHKVGILHGDLKADNCLVRLDPEADLTAPYNCYGNDGWSKKGLTLIDFGRGIDTRAFKPDARFIADWKAEETDCPEIREAKPWKWEIDFFGAANVIHSLLFGKYIETVSVGGGGLGQRKEWKLRDNFKRYWEKDIWTDVFTVLINGGGKKEDEARKDLQRIRHTMEAWLEKEGERNGRDLRGGIRRCERLVGGGSGAKGRR